MNFLSHYYFERNSADSLLVMGTVLPDLAKNANKFWALHPHRHLQLFRERPALMSLYTGWQRHLDVDRHFHGSEFFNDHTSSIRVLVLPLLCAPVRPSFFAHIALELLLDSLLITDEVISCDDFYHHLAAVGQQDVLDFLQLNGVQEPEAFRSFLGKFLSSRYLRSYRDVDQIVYALGRICERVWPGGYPALPSAELAAILTSYRTELQTDYLDIFRSISEKLVPLA